MNIQELNFLAVSCRLFKIVGRPEIQPERYERLSEAVRKCISDSDDFSVVLEDGKIYISAYHHDGCNNFTISPVLGRYPNYLF